MKVRLTLTKYEAETLYLALRKSTKWRPGTLRWRPGTSRRIANKLRRAKRPHYDYATKRWEE
jgi:hypothetical protein